MNLKINLQNSENNLNKKKIKMKKSFISNLVCLMIDASTAQIIKAVTGEGEESSA